MKGGWSRKDPEGQLATFAEILSEQHNGRWLSPSDVAEAMGLERYRGNALMQRLRKYMGEQAC